MNNLSYAYSSCCSVCLSVHFLEMVKNKIKLFKLAEHKSKKLENLFIIIILFWDYFIFNFS